MGVGVGGIGCMCQWVCVYISGGGVCASEGGVYVCVLVGVRVGNVFGVDKRYCPRHSLAHPVMLCALRLFSVGSVT